MGMTDGVAQVRGASIPASEQSAILGGRARSLLHLDDQASVRASA
jgi:hypothetical protein